MNERQRNAARRSMIALLHVATTAQAGMSLPGQFAVDHGGGAGYSIPIQVAPGTAGMQPALSLNYHSLSGNGLPGMGWSLSGLSAITRCPKTVAQDGVVEGVNLDANDRYCLDGQRLVAVAGAYGAAGAEYRTELDSFAKIVSHGAAGDGPEWFTVWTKSGERLSYGSAVTGRIEAQGSATTRLWLLDLRQDVMGNYSTITYFKDIDNGDVYPQRIDYSGNFNTGVAPDNAVQFHYEARPDASSAYQSGSLIRNAVRLTRIDIFAAGQPVRHYQLTHDEEIATRRSRLTRVAECEPGGACLPATVFGYSSNRPVVFGANAQSGTIDWGYQSGREWVDANRDGLADYCRVIGDDGAMKLACTFSTGGGFGQTVTSGVIDPGYEEGRAWVDLNGDGKPDYCRVVGDAGANSGVSCTLFSGSAFGATITSETLDWGYNAGRAWVDVDGDGRADFCRLVGADHAKRVSCTLSTGAGFGATQMSAPLDPGYEAGRAWVDVDGNGRPDYCRMIGDGPANSFAACTLSTAGGFGATLISDLLDWGYQPGRAWTDVNGDGKADFCRVTGSSGAFRLACTVMTGAGFGPTISAAIADPGYDFGRSWVDVNGDGNADFCRVTGHLGSTTLACVLATGSGFGASIVSEVLDAGYDAGRAWVDMNGDGSADYCRVIGDGGAEAYLACTPIVFDLKGLTSITSGLGQRTTIQYKPLTDASMYTADTHAAWPQLDVTAAQYLVAAVSSSNGIGGAVSTSYQYGGLKSDLSGRGSLGMRWMQATQIETGISTRSEFRQDWPYTGQAALVRKSIAGGGNGGLLHQSANQFGCTDFVSANGCNVTPGRRYFPFVPFNEEANWDVNGAPLPTHTTSTDYDGGDSTTQTWPDLNGIYGNPTRIISTTSDGYTKTTVNTWLNDTVNWFVGRLTRATLTSAIP